MITISIPDDVAEGVANSIKLLETFNTYESDDFKILREAIVFALQEEER